MTSATATILKRQRSHLVSALFVSIVAGATATAETPQATERASSSAPRNPLITGSGDTIIYRPEFFARSRASTALEMVQLVPGFSIRGGSAGRGLDATATNVLIDGRQQPPKSAPIASALARIPASSVVAVMRLRGMQPGIDMAGFSEVLNVIRFPRTDTGATLTASAGESAAVDSRSFGASGTHGRPGRAASASFNTNEGSSSSDTQLARQDGTAAVHSESRSRGSTGSGGVDLAFGRNTTLRSDISYGETDSTSTQRRSLAGGTSLDTSSHSDSTLKKVGARLDRTLRNDLTASVDAVRSDSSATSRSLATTSTSETTFASARDTSETAFGLTLHHRPTGPWQLEGGVDYALNELEGLSALGVNGEPTPLSGSNVLVREHRYGTALKLTRAPKGPAGRWSASARVRIDTARITGERALDDARSFTDIKPEFNLHGRLSEDRQIDIRIAREVDQLAFSAFTAFANLSDDVITLGNPELDPERRWVLETSLHQAVFDTGAFTLTARGEYTDNPTERVRTPAGFDAPDNIDASLSSRLNAQLALPLDAVGLDNVRLDLNAALGTSRLTDPTTDEARRQSGDLRYSWSARLRHTLEDPAISYGFSANANRNAATYSPSEISRIISSPSVSGYLEYDFTKNLSLRAELNYSGAITTDRELYTGTRATGTRLERETQSYPSTLGGQITLKLEI